MLKLTSPDAPRFWNTEHLDGAAYRSLLEAFAAEVPDLLRVEGAEGERRFVLWGGLLATDGPDGLQLVRDALPLIRYAAEAYAGERGWMVRTNHVAHYDEVQVLTDEESPRLLASERGCDLHLTLLRAVLAASPQTERDAFFGAVYEALRRGEVPDFFV